MHAQLMGAAGERLQRQPGEGCAVAASSDDAIPSPLARCAPSPDGTRACPGSALRASRAGPTCVGRAGEGAVRHKPRCIPPPPPSPASGEGTPARPRANANSPGAESLPPAPSTCHAAALRSCFIHQPRGVLAQHQPPSPPPPPPPPISAAPLYPQLPALLPHTHFHPTPPPPPHLTLPPPLTTPLPPPPPPPPLPPHPQPQDASRHYSSPLGVSPRHPHARNAACMCGGSGAITWIGARFL